MKVIAIGVHSAFAAGKYEEVIPTKQVRELIVKMARSPDFKEVSEELITAEIDQLSQLFYKPRWQSNFLIEFDMPSKKGGRPHRLLIDAGAMSDML
jgi:hypothetical protein